MSLKDVWKSLTDKKEQNLAKENDAVNALIASDHFPIVRAADVDMSQYKRIPLIGLSALGAAFAQLPVSARILTTTVTQTVGLDEPLFIGLNPKGVNGFIRDYGLGTSGNIMQVNQQGKQVIAGRMRFKAVDSLPIAETTTTVVPFDPMTMVIAAALFNLDQKLDSLQKKAEEIIQFLKLEKQSKQRGNLNMLSEILEEYKRDCANEKMCSLRIVAVQDIKRDAHQDILFYQEQIARQLQEQRKLHGEKQTQNLLDRVASEFREYQLACYLYGFASFLEVMLQKEFESAHLQSVEKKMQEYAQRYTALYADCQGQIAAYQRSAIEAKVLGNLGAAAKAVGGRIAANPLLSKGPVDEALLSASESLGKHNRNVVASKLDQLSPLKDCRLDAFVENIQTLDTLCNQREGLLTDGEHLYMLKSA